MVGYPIINVIKEKEYDIPYPVAYKSNKYFQKLWVGKEVAKFMKYWDLYKP